MATRDPAGRTLSNVWCSCGTLDALVDAKGQRTSWERDLNGRVTREIRADGTTDTNYTYDLAGRLKTITDPKDQVTTHEYNVDDSLSGTAYTNEEVETPNVSYTYDSRYARVATMVDGMGTTSYSYRAPGTNGAGQVATIDGPLSNDTITYTYDELGRVIQRTIDGSANEVDWTFDALGRVTTEENPLGEFTFTYDGVTNRRATVTYPNGQTSTYSYFDETNDHRLQTIHHRYPNAGTLSRFDYTYDAVGNIATSRQQADSTAVLWKYGYDQADQLISAVKHATDASQTVLQRFAYAYDPAGNRTVEQIDDVVTLSTYNVLNRLTSQVPGGQMVVAGNLNEPGTVTISGASATVDANNNFRGKVPTTTGTNAFTIVAKDASGNTTTQQFQVDVAGTARSFAYDTNGNLLSDGTRSFTWDAKNRMVTGATTSQAIQFAYDGRDRRSRVIQVDGSTVSMDNRIVWCLTNQCEFRDSTGSVISRINDLGAISGSSPQFYATDRLGSVTDVLSDSGTLEARYAYAPYGQTVKVSGSAESMFGYTGHQWSSVLGLHLPLYRGYDPLVGRWLSEDPIGLEGGPNRYAYVNGNPTSRFDPMGLMGACEECNDCPGGVWVGVAALAELGWGFWRFNVGGLGFGGTLGAPQGRQW